MSHELCDNLHEYKVLGASRVRWSLVQQSLAVWQRPWEQLLSWELDLKPLGSAASEKAVQEFAAGTRLACEALWGPV